MNTFIAPQNVDFEGLFYATYQSIKQNLIGIRIVISRAKNLFKAFKRVLIFIND